ncbi:TGM1-like protein [Mya arenaria]|uniref:TGM1-like protein n=1 Tax=Mya arenaria TaxID=6604 RepID=A0ABY7FQA7_MYAAR|nr:TGM1-like protein [Mya arenaria]
MFSRYGNTPYLGYSDRQPYAGNYNISSYRRGDASVRTSYYGPSRRTRYSWERDSLINRNRGSNTTDEYDRTSSRSVGDQQLPAELVIRRGDSFRITLTFDRPYDVEMHDIRLNFSLGEVKSSEQGTEVEFYVYEKGRVAFKPFQWDGCIVQLRSNSVTVEFDEGILDVALFLMRRGFKEVNLRGMSDPATVARMIAQWVNSRDDEGILVGNWTGKYFGGTKPTAWAGSVKILQQNFHVWNEVWMSRPDLDTHGRFDGWQVIDSTPQEKSNGVFTCGPAPLAAIKEGMCNIKYDTGFVFAEVNADEVHWEQLPKFGTLRRLKLNTAEDAFAIREKEFILLSGSEAERRAVMMAHQTAKAPIPDTYAVEKEQEFLKFKLLHSNEVMIGSDLDVDLVAFNHTGTEQTVTAAFIKVYPKTYDGKTGPMFFKRDFDWVKVRPGGNVPMRATITVRDYLPHIFELANLFIEASASVQSTGSQPPQSVYKSHDFRFRRPDMYVKAPERCYIGRLSQFEVTFRNPLPVRLVNCDISMESDAFEDIRDERVPDVPEWGVFSKTFRLVPRRLRGHHVVFSFDCSTLEDISGSASVYIER